MIIIYSKEERSGMQAATLFSEKGFENVFLLSGGIEEFTKLYPEMCDGPGVERLINEKLMEEKKKNEAMMKSQSKLSKFQKTTASVRANSVDVSKISMSSKLTTQSNNKGTTGMKNQISDLKKNLK